MLIARVDQIRILFFGTPGIGMEFGIKKCGVVIMKREKLSKTDGIVLPNGETNKEVEKSGYK